MLCSSSNAYVAFSGSLSNLNGESKEVVRVENPPHCFVPNSDSILGGDEMMTQNLEIKGTGRCSNQCIRSEGKE